MVSPLCVLPLFIQNTEENYLKNCNIMLKNTPNNTATDFLIDYSTSQYIMTTSLRPKAEVNITKIHRYIKQLDRRQSQNERHQTSHWRRLQLQTSSLLRVFNRYTVRSSSSPIYLPYFHIKLQTYIMQWQATRKTQSSTRWRPIINRTVENILLRKNIQ